MVDIFNSIKFLSSNLPLFLSLISIIVILLGWRVKGISLLQPLEEIAYKQENYRRLQELRQFKKKMVIRNLKLGNSFLDAYNLEAAKTEFEKALNIDPTNIEAHMGLIKSEVFQPLEKDPAYYDPDIAVKKIDLIMKEKENEYLFSWNEISGKDSVKFIEFLRQNYGVNWVRTKDIKKIDNDTLIKVFSANKSISFRIDKEKSKAILEIDNEKTEFSMKKENNKLNIYENDKHALLFLGIVYTAFNKEKALEYLNAAVLSDPKFAIAYSNIAKVYAMQNENDKSLATMKKAASLSKWNPIINNSLGYQYLINDKYEEAIEQLNFLLKFDPYYLIVYWNLSNAYRMIGKFQLAYERQKKLIVFLENQNVTSLRRNRIMWFFNTESVNGVLFYDILEKKSYSYYSMAFTCYLIDKKEEAQEYIDEAQKLSCDKISSMEFLNFNIKCLQTKDSNLKLDEFRAMLPNLDF